MANNKMHQPIQQARLYQEKSVEKTPYDGYEATLDKMVADREARAQQLAGARWPVMRRFDTALRRLEQTGADALAVTELREVRWFVDAAMKFVPQEK